MIIDRREADAAVLPADARDGVSPEDERQGHSGRWRTVGVAGLGFIVAVLVAVGFGLGVYGANVHNGLIAAPYTAVGVFVVLRRPRNRVGWLFLATGVAHAVMFFGRQYGFYASTHRATTLPGVSWVTWLGVWPLALVLVLAGTTIMCFPDGRLPSLRWRKVVAAMAGVGVLLAGGSALWPVEYQENSLSVPHPLHVAGYDTARQLFTPVAAGAYLLFQVIWAACVIVRLRRAKGDEVQQLKWFVYVVAVGAVTMVLSMVLLGSPVLGLVVVPAVPIVAGVAIVKYRLYDIDLVINKTLVVGAMAALITATYVAVVVGVGRLVGLSASPDLGLSLVATAVVAVAFEPVRRRVQVLADRLVYGHRPTPYEALARLSNQLSLDGQRADLLAGLASTFAKGVGAAEATLWAGAEDQLVPVASWPPAAGQDAPVSVAVADLAPLGGGGRTHVRTIVHQGTLRGAVTLTKAAGEALTTAEDRLLGDLVAQAGLVIDNVGLAAELQHRLNQISAQAAELRAAAKRIVAAQDDARRRIERDLHDGAQQRLVTLALSLQAVSERAAAGTDEDLAAKVSEARRQLIEALAELREMARGIHPAILTEEGLEAALGFLAERAPVAVHLQVDLDRRLAREVEATAYFVVSEALTNAAKHAAASSIEVKARIEDGRLLIEVTDNGRGGADDWGSGLQGLTDRLATLNGRLTVNSPPGAGTRLRAEIPCG